MSKKPTDTEEAKARAYFEAIRWPDGAWCPHCGEAKRVYRLEGKSHRPGLFHCNSCNGQFTVTTGSVMESSHIPLSKWALGFKLFAASKKGFSAHQLHRMLGITYKSAWFMAHRIREAMDNPIPSKAGGGGKTVEMDETYWGKEESQGKPRALRGGRDKMKIVTLVERGGQARSFHLKALEGETIEKIIYSHLDKSTSLMTDESSLYKIAPKYVAKHETVNHGREEYARGNVHTNTVEGFFGIFKRGMTGVYQHCSTQHLHRYLAEFDFRYSNRAARGVDDLLRTQRAIRGAEGKRLMYRQADRRQPPQV